MRSSIATAGRALIMLSCAVGMPMLALSGTSWQAALKKIQEFHWPTLQKFVSADATLPSSSPTTVSIVGPAEKSKRSDTGSDTWNRAVQDCQNVMPISYQAPTQTSAVASPISAQETPGDPFETIPKRLQQLGATYYLLESWGNQPSMYRFYCKMAIGGTADYTRCFEAVQSDPLQAMRQVLHQVEVWRSGPN